ncbi:MAG: tetratricopeptide repeat protein [Halioglobus sp.]|nr:tetratricopeptide repeat protein [Halioglobus sp.]
MDILTTTAGTTHPLHLLARIAALVFAAFLLLACSEELTDEEYVIRAEAALKSGDLNATAIELKNALRSNPTNARARLLLGQTYYTLGDGPSSEKELRRAQEMGIDVREVHIPLARAVLMAGEHEKLLEEFPVESSLPIEEQATLLALHGLAHLYLADLLSARAAFDQSLQINPKEVDALLGQAYVDKGLGDYASAREWLGKAMALDDKRAEGWSLMGELEVMAGEREAAVEAFGKAIEYAPRPDPYRLQRALLYIDMRNYPKAREDIRWLPAQLPGKHYARGLIELQREDFLKAQASFEQSLSKYESYPPAQ